VDDLLKKNRRRQTLDKLDPKDGRYLPRTEMLQAAETALAAASYTQGGARGRPRQDRSGSRRRAVAPEAVRRAGARAGALSAEGDWNAAVPGPPGSPRRTASRSTASASPRSRRRRPARASTANSPTTRRKRPAPRSRRSRACSPAARRRPIIKPLRARALALFAEAEELRKKGKYKEADAPLRDAQTSCRALSGLGEETHKLDTVFSILRVGVSELPVNMVPGLAATDAELLAGELLFRGAGAGAAAAGGGQRYDPRWPNGCRRRPAGRQFRLARNAYWSDGEPVTAADVRATVLLLKDPKWPGYNPALAKLVEKADLRRRPLPDRPATQPGLPRPAVLDDLQVLPAGADKWSKEKQARPVGIGRTASGDIEKSEPDGVPASPWTTCRRRRQHFEGHQGQRVEAALAESQVDPEAVAAQVAFSTSFARAVVAGPLRVFEQQHVARTSAAVTGSPSDQ